MLKLLYTIFLIPFLISAANGADSTGINALYMDSPFNNVQEEKILPPLPHLIVPDLLVNRQILNSKNYYYRNSISIYGDFYSNSNAVTHAFANKILFKEFITTENKDQVSEKLKEKNRFGAELNAGISYARSLDTLNSLQLLVKYKYNNLNTSTFSDDAFNLLFRGNAYFENETADISGLNFMSLVYSQFQAGLYKKFNNSHFGAGALISLNQGSNISFLDIEKASLFTADAGEYLEINSNFSGTFSDTSKFAEYAMNGLGASLDMIFTYSGKYNFNVSVQDLGFISWNDKTAQIEMDTAFQFEGIEINQIIMAADPFEELSQDSIFNVFGISYIEKGQTRMLPLTIKANVSTYFNNWFAAAGVQHRFFENFSPLVYVKADRLWNSVQAHAGVVVSYGGYGGLNVGAEAGKMFGNRFGLKIGSTSLISYFAPNSLTGSSGYFLLSASF